MDFSLDEESKSMVESLKKFLAAEVLPVEADLKKRGILVGGAMTREVYDEGAKIRAKAVEAGFYTAHVPEAIGGGGLRHVTLTAMRETIAMCGSEMMAVFVMGDPPMGPTAMLSMLNDVQKDKYLHKLMSGEWTTCFCLTEPNVGSDVGALELMAVRDGDDYVLNGTKIFISNGLFADVFQVFACTEKGKGMGGGLSLFMVDGDTKGITRTLMKSMGGDDFQAELNFEDVRVPAENLVGQEGYGFLGATQWLSGERLMMSTQAVGLAEYSLKFGVEWAQTRKAFGKPIGKYQGVSFPLADCRIQLDAARALTYQAAWKLDQGEMAMQDLAVAKVFAADMLQKVVDTVMQTLGGIGYMTDHPIERIYRIARVFRFGGGTSEIQRKLIAKGMGL